MKLFNYVALMTSALGLVQLTYAHYPYVAPLSYQTFNHHTAILSGFYDNPFASEIHIKNFKFHYHVPSGEKIEIEPAAWGESQTLSTYTLENKTEGTYRIRGVKEGSISQYAYHEKAWKMLLNGELKADRKMPDHVVLRAQLNKKDPIKTVQTIELIETFVSKNKVTDGAIHAAHDGFNIQFKTHPNAIKVNQVVQFNFLDTKHALANLDVQILKQTHDFKRDEKVYKQLKTNDKGELNFTIDRAGLYLLKVDYQQPFTTKSDALKRYKYTLSFNVIE